MEYIHELKEKLCDELEEIAKQPDLSAGELDAVDKMVHTVKNLMKIEMMKQQEEYSRDGAWMARGSYSQARDGYSRGNSYEVNGGYSQKRDSMGRYSRGGARDQMMAQLEIAMRNADSERDRDMIRRCMEQLEKG